MTENAKRVQVDLNKISLAIKLRPVAKYEDGTWGAQIESIVINGLPKPKVFSFPAITALNKPIFLMIEKGKATLEQQK
jgi:hypothetical protein